MNCDVCNKPECDWQTHNLKWRYVPFNPKTKTERGLEYLQTWRVLQYNDMPERGQYYGFTRLMENGWWITAYVVPGITDSAETVFKNLLAEGVKPESFFENYAIFFDVEGEKQ